MPVLMCLVALRLFIIRHFLLLWIEEDKFCKSFNPPENIGLGAFFHNCLVFRSLVTKNANQGQVRNPFSWKSLTVFVELIFKDHLFVKKFMIEFDKAENIFL